eukprot:TRINITY_DN9380_c0_g1_i1.p1 TRINITY_DN9380_c0_g1~~TRINITY_DN9380_c0_g1_i1.p1  ORF type:complete len:139 (-),score=18.82 TRINITY_DN9380_c0_g1_i1:294-710(-)
MHSQVPGGRVDREELEKYGEENAALVAAARELWEETGLDYRGDRMEMLRPLGKLRAHRYYFQLQLPSEQPELEQRKGSKAVSATTGECYELLLSKEHVGFIFEKDLLTAADDIKNHSGGHNTSALRKVANSLDRGTVR